MPQAWVQMIPSFTNLLIQLLKCTPLLWLLSAADLMTAIEHVRSRSGESLTTYLLLLAVYFVLAYALTLLMNMLERTAKRRLGLHTGAGSLLKTRSGGSRRHSGRCPVNQSFQWDAVGDAFPLLLEGFRVTLLATVLGTLRRGGARAGRRRGRAGRPPGS